MRISVSAVMVAILYVCTESKLSLVEGTEKVCFSLVEEGRLEAVENNIKMIKELLATKKLDFCGCSNYLVSGVHGVADDKITASTIHDSRHAAKRARLYDLSDRTSTGTGAWSSRTPNNREYIQVELNGISSVTGIVTQGRRDLDQWVTSYKVMYSVDGSTWKTVQDELRKDRIFTGNSDRNTPVTHHLDWPIKTRFVRLQVVTWHSFSSLRFDVIGCPAGKK